MDNKEQDINSFWSMDSETCRAIRSLLNECNEFTKHSMHGEKYLSIMCLAMESIPVIKDTILKKYNINDNQNKLIKEHNDYEKKRNNNNGERFDISSYKKALYDFEFSLRMALSDEGILMAKGDDPRLAFGGGKGL